MNNFNKFAFDLSNAKGLAELRVNGKPYKVKIDNISQVRSTDGDEVQFNGEVLNTDLNYHDFIWQFDDTFKKYIQNDVETARSVVRTTGHSTPYYPNIRKDISKVIFNNPATIIIWKDGTKTVVKCQEGEIFDEEKGLAMAISKRVLGDKGNFNEVFKEYVKNEPEKKEEPEPERGTKKASYWIVTTPQHCKRRRTATCSVCGDSYTTSDVMLDDLYKHCPHCGAKMTGMGEKK